MKTIRVCSRVASMVGVIVLFLAVSPATAQDNGAPLVITFTKWVTTFPRMEGIVAGLPKGGYVGEILERQVSTNSNLNGIIKLEAIYEVRDGNGNFLTALIRGGTNAVTGVARLDGFVLAGFRTGAPVRVEFKTIPAATGCAGAPPNTTCFQGTIHLGGVPPGSH